MDQLSKDIKTVMDTIRSIHISSGLKAINLLSIPCINEYEPQILQNLICIAYKAIYNTDTYAFGGLDYYLPGLSCETYDFRGQGERLIELGFDGIKFIESKPYVRKAIGDIPFTSEIYEGLFTYLEERSIPILWHAADPGYFWDADLVPHWAVERGMFYGTGEYMSKEAYYKEVEDVLSKHPGLNIIFAHFFFLSADMERADRFLDKWPNICFDVTPGVDMYEDFYTRSSDWRDFFIRHQDRIIFGTDTGYDIENDPPAPAMVQFGKKKSNWVRRFLEDDESFTMFDSLNIMTRGIGLEEEALEKIYHANFMRFAGSVPIKVSIPGVMNYLYYIKNKIEGSRQIAGKNELLGRISSIEDELRDIN